MCGKSQYVTTPDSKRGKTENGPYKSEKIKKLYIKKKLTKKWIEMFIKEIKHVWVEKWNKRIFT